MFSHFSVKEFLVDSKIAHSDADRFSINAAKSHGFIATACILYLQYCNKFHSTPGVFPLLPYSWDYWPLHAVADTVDLTQDQKQAASALFENISLCQTPLRNLEVPTSIQDVMYKIDLASLKTPYFYEEYDGTVKGGTYQYHELPRIGADAVIRLVEIHPSTDLFAETRCSLISVSLNEAPEYEAISHHWDGHSESCLRVNGLVLEVPSSIQFTLRALRSVQGTWTRPIWIHGACINSKDMVERMQQRCMISTIFTKASQVFIYLGPSTDMDIAVDVLKEVYSLVSLPATTNETGLTGLHRVVESLNGISPFLAMRNLFERQWWTRSWTLQELIVSCPGSGCSI